MEGLDYLHIDCEGILTIDIMEVPANCVVVISDGRAKLRALSDHGEYRIVTHQGQVKRMRKEEGEEF